MTRRAVRVIWILVGLCLAFGSLRALVMLLGAPDQPWQQALYELSTLLDVVALLLWMGIFAIYWSRGVGTPRRWLARGKASR